jgi:hypothetical protein
LLELFSAHSVIYALAGVAFLGGAIVPRLVGHLPASPPMLFLGLGLLVFALPLGLGTVDPIEHSETTEYLTEIGVIVSLMGAGLKLDRPLGWRTWQPTVRLLAITMPVTILLTSLVGWWAVGLAPATALLLGAVLAPTDPVLAAEVQVGPPGGEPDEEDDLRFSLTSEAGLNDALAFPFTNAAIAMALAGGSASAGCWSGWPSTWSTSWRRSGGRHPGRQAARRDRLPDPDNLRLASRGEGFVALAGTFLAYGATELANGYGFLAVFVAAVVLRRSESGHDYHQTLHDFAEQTEQLLMIALVVLLGGAVAGASSARSPGRRRWPGSRCCSSSARWSPGSAWPAPPRPSASGRPSRSSASAASARCTTWPTRWARRSSRTPSCCGRWWPSRSSSRSWCTAPPPRW